MKQWMLGLFLLLAACSTQNDEEVVEEISTNMAENNITTPVDDEGSEDAGQVSASSPTTSLKRPSELAERERSSVMSYERAGIVPLRIVIPAIEVDATIEHVGLLASGQMDEPSEMEDVAWFEGGYMPGEQGSSVLAGHVDSRTGPAIFFDLDKLEQGDEIIITDGDGEEKVFVVQKSEAYNRNDAPLQQIFGYSYRSQLNLITCTGEFNTEAGTHDERLVVYTVLKEDL
ncbi:class F sortase [Salipaludibacillus sp. HK11]|uniref:class F sortase n=1 Tax=Salipaludibacillus sp. HK11 TaxID=3394320 RepID=UPI0039FD6F5A